MDGPSGDKPVHSTRQTTNTLYSTMLYLISMVSLLYRSERIGLNGKPFTLLKVKTLRDGGGSFAHERAYVWGGRFMRKFRVDELPQIINWFRNEMNLFGPRQREAK